MAGPTFELHLFDDRAARAWAPFSLTRPAGELVFGSMTLRRRAAEALGASVASQIAARHLDGFVEPGAPPAVASPEPRAERDRLLLCSRAVLEPDAARAVGEWGRRGGRVAVAGEPAGWFVPAGQDAPDTGLLESPDQSDSGPVLQLPGSMLRHPWELIARNPDRLAADLVERWGGRDTSALPAGVHLLGTGDVSLGSDVEIEPGVVLDTRHGPIRLDDGVRVRAFTRLAGPAWVGPRSQLLGGPIEAVSIGPVCRIRGEFAESICLGYSNKQHDGHIGHAYLGRWVNLGAETTNSDLKNNYGTIRMWTPDGPADTGLIKLGSLIGDHVKTGIGLLLNTGTLIGAGSNLFGAVMPPTYVPPFSWGQGEELTEYRVAKFLEVAERAMGRRDVVLEPAMRTVLERAAEMARAEREG
jgi:UDP-N-acetylglucosamine diphosphorylase / glucose-1-phosphate thymidylyltransferase / UDP-N-acetylgalactosamine diphosphorylase / glucosamine-1-phosphate N-acetyltransferase / galactosamine-1-phosphate N-acetyltransferase